MMNEQGKRPHAELYLNDEEQDILNDVWAKIRAKRKRETGSLLESYYPSVDDIDRAARDADPDPTDAQKECGNYRKGHITIQGVPITIEVAAGNSRKGIGEDGKAWSVVMNNHYGYIKRTESEADGDHIDVFLGPDPRSEIVFVITQIRQDGSFDENKCMIGWSNSFDAKKAYMSNYKPGWKGFGGIVAMPMDAFKDWLASHFQR